MASTTAAPTRRPPSPVGENQRIPFEIEVPNAAIYVDTMRQELEGWLPSRNSTRTGETAALSSAARISTDQPRRKRSSGADRAISEPFRNAAMGRRLRRCTARPMFSGRCSATPTPTRDGARTARRTAAIRIRAALRCAQPAAFASRRRRDNVLHAQRTCVRHPDEPH